jgi:rare lipoprotein A
VRLVFFAAILAVSGCGTIPQKDAPPASQSAAPVPAKGAYYKDDGPGANPPPDLAAIPDAVPKAEPPHRFAHRPYQVFGKDYVPAKRVAPFRQSGIGSWYGRRYDGSATSSGERYDMYAMSAAHPTLPIPSYARVTNLANGRNVVVRINDRGPFHSDRIIDLSYVAAWKLGYAEAGSARVEVEEIVPGFAPAVAAPSRVEREQKQATAEAKGIYLQLGVFSGREAAENFRVRVYRELAWLSEAIEVVAGGDVFRLFLGPYRTSEEARPIADRIQAEFKLRPLLVAR